MKKPDEIWLICFRDVDASIGAVAINIAGPFPRFHLKPAIEVAFEPLDNSPAWDGVWVYNQEPPSFEDVAMLMKSGTALGTLPGAEVLFTRGDKLAEYEAWVKNE